MSSGTSKRRKVSLNNNNKKESNTPSVIASAASVVVSSSSSTRKEEEEGAVVTPQLDEIPQLVLVELQKNDGQTVVQALKKLHSLLYDDGSTNSQLAQYKQDVFWTGAPALIVLTMKNPLWQFQEPVQIWACQCLLRVAANCDEGPCAILQAGGVEAIVTCLKAFPSSGFVQIPGCIALQNIFCDLDKDPVHRIIARGATRFVQDLNGLDLVKKAMLQFDSNDEMQSTGCGLYYNLSFQKGLHTSLIKAGAVTAAGAALERFSDDEEVNESVKGFMKNMFAAS